MRGALKRVLGDEEEGPTGEDSMSQEDLASLMSQLREARSLLREQDAIMFAAIFDRCGGTHESCLTSVMLRLYNDFRGYSSEPSALCLLSLQEPQPVKRLLNSSGVCKICCIPPPHPSTFSFFFSRSEF